MLLFTLFKCRKKFFSYPAARFLNRHCWPAEVEQR
ncbi:hypothetical protein BN432_1318 [Erwinia amylovora Ea356]|nr:hypothetical protein BN432_1318 [Erwinia amylovora Ea356]